MIDADDTRLMQDARYLALWEAQQVWKVTFMQTSKERLEHVRGIHRHEVFSLNQIAKICRVSASSVSRKIKANAGGGRFDPATLKSLLIIRRAVLSHETLKQYLLQDVVESGTSISATSKLTGASTTTLYRILST